MDIFSLLGTSANASSGAMDGDTVQELRKALEAGYGSDSANFEQGAAFRIESLEKTMLATIQENHHFRLFNQLQKSGATSTVDEWTEQSGVGGFRGGSTNSETGVIRQTQGNYKRRVEQVKFLMTRRQVSVVLNVANNIVEAQATEYQNGAVELLGDAEYLCFEGDKTVVPTEYDGIYQQVLQNATADHIVDMRGQPLNNITRINDAAALISGYGNFGVPTDIYCSQNVQADFDNYLDPAFRVPLTDVANGGVSIGSPVRGIRSSWGDIANKPDVFVRDENRMIPFELEYPVIAAANIGIKPVSVTPGTPASNANSKFVAGEAGNYYYAIAGISAEGQSAAVVSAQVAIAAGEAVALSIVRSAGDQETGYVIYRSRKGGTNDLADMREMIRIPKAVSGPTVYTDLGTEVPGSSKAYILNMTPGHKAITWRQMLPMTKFPLYPTDRLVVPWAQALFGYLRLGKSRHHVVFKNIVTTNAKWRPFD